MEDTNVTLKRSIRNRINRLLIVSVLGVAIFMTVVNVVITDKYVGRNSETLMRNTCELQSLRVNSQLHAVEQAVDSIYQLSASNRPSVEQLESAWRTRAHVHGIENNAIEIARATEGVLSVYYRIDPNLTSDSGLGFSYTKTDDGAFEQQKLLNLLDYSPSDLEHVGWYYIPVLEKKPVWLDGYYNEKLGDKNIISYVMPVIENNIVIGVIGMDVDFDSIITVVEDVDAYTSSGAVLAGISSGNVYYERCDLFGDEMTDDLKSELANSDHSLKLLTHNTNKGPFLYSFETLSNGMKLIVYASKSDVDAQKQTTVFISIILFIIFLSLTISASTRITKRITEPIVRIAGVARSYAQGDWDATVTCDTNDELQVLSENISVMAKKTKQYIEYINNMALKDELTGIRNKTAYRQYVDKINLEYIGTDKKFAVLVCDINNLKVVNDTMGHEEGDKLIFAASRYICKIFSHSPVFRIGGDEFVVILDTEDFARKDILVSEFKRTMKSIPAEIDVTRPVIAIGMALHDDDGRVYDDIFAVADQRMYANKLELKGDETKIR